MLKKYFLLLTFLGFALFGQNTRKFTIAAVGDIMFGTDYPFNRLPQNEGEALLQDVSEILSSADITFGNYEGVLLDGGEPHKECKDTTMCYLYRTPTKYVKNLTKAGFDLISLANNHANDFGSPGLTSTINTLTNAGLKYSGPIGKTETITIDSLKFGFIAFCTGSGMYTIMDIPRAIEEVKKLKQENDIVIVSFHGGAEGKKALHIANTMEFAYGEKRGNVIEFAHSVIDAGADLVIGHGPHVPRAIEIYNDRLIAYSLGNFCTYSGFNIAAENGYAPILKAELNADGTLSTGEIISRIQVRSIGTRVDKQKSAFNLMKKLTQSDLPDSKIIFTDDGKFYPQKK